MDQGVTHEEQVVNQADQIPKRHGAKAGDDAQAESEKGDLRQRQGPVFVAIHHIHRSMWGRPLFRADAALGDSL